VRYAVLYSPSSVQRIMDFIKTAYAFRDAIPVVVKPIGAGAQIGVPEAYKYSYRVGKPLIILPELTDLFSILHVSEAYYITSRGVEVSVRDLSGKNNVAFIVSSGEGEPSKKELEGVKSVAVRELPVDLPPASLLAVLLYTLEHGAPTTT